MQFSVTILGTSSAIPNSKRNPSAQVVNVHDRLFLVDCGEGTQILLRKNKVKLSKINHICISHLHGDHIYGLFGLLSTFSLLNRSADLHIYANPELKRLLDFHDDFFENELTYSLVFHPLEPGFTGIIFEDDHLTIEAFPLRHSIPSHGFVFKEKDRLKKISSFKINEYGIEPDKIKGIKMGDDYLTKEGNLIPNSELTSEPPLPRSYAYCSDTKYYPKVAEFIPNVDLLYHESTFANSEKDRAKATQHSTAEQAAKIAQKSNCKHLLLGHFSTRYKDLSLLLNEAKAIFENTEIAEENKTYSIEEVLP
jgi:ribonuclease Z